MVNRHSQTGFAHIVLLVTVAVVLAVAATLFTRNALAVRREASLYAQADAQVQKYIGDINKKFPGKVTSSRGCSYTHEKYSKGQLGCGVEATYERTAVNKDEERILISEADELIEGLRWNFAYDNTKQNTEENPNLLKHFVYKNANLLCSIDYRKKAMTPTGQNIEVFDKELTLVIQADCSGTARAEHYPIGG